MSPETAQGGEVKRTGDWAVLLAWAGLGALFLAVSVQKIWSGDFWGQLRAGQWIIENWRVPRTDWYTFTREGTPWIEVRWLFEAALALGWKVGPWLLCWGQAVLLGVMWGVLIWRSRRVMWTPWGVMVLGLAVAAGSGRWVLRPELVTDLLIAVFLVGLEGAQRWGGERGSGGFRRFWARGWWLVPAQVVWVNSHSVYVFGPILAWLFAGSELAEAVLKKTGLKWPEREDAGEAAGFRGASRLAVLALLITAACWVNPYGHAGAMYALEMWRQSRAGHVVAETLSELRSPLSVPILLWRWDLWASALLALVVAASFVLNRRRAPVARWLVFAMAVYLAAGAQRNAALLAVMGCWAGLRNFDEWRAGGGGETLKSHGAWLVQGVMAACGIVAAGFAWHVGTDRVMIGMNVAREAGVGVVEWDLATGAADFVTASGARGQVFNTMRDGHYLGWRSGGRIKTYVDGRTDVMGDALMREFTTTSPVNWDERMRARGVNTAILQVRWFEGLVEHLVVSPEWKLVYLDHRNVVFVRDIPEHAELLAKHRIDLNQPWRPPGPEPVEEVEGWKRLIGGPGRPWYTMGMAQTFMALGSVVNAGFYLERTLGRYPGNERAIAELAALYRLTGHKEAGDRLIRDLPADSAWVEHSERTLASFLLKAGRQAEAIVVLERAARGRVRDPQLRIVLADQYFQTGNFPGAKAEYEAAISDGWDTAAEWMKLGTARERTGDPAGAAEAYRRSLRLDAEQHQVWYLLGMTLAARGDKAAAADAFSRALRIKADYGPARRALDALGGSR